MTSATSFGAKDEHLHSGATPIGNVGSEVEPSALEVIGRAVNFYGHNLEVGSKWLEEEARKFEKIIDRGLVWTISKLDTENGSDFQNGFNIIENYRQELHCIINTSFFYRVFSSIGRFGGGGLCLFAKAVTYIVTSPIRAIEKVIGLATGDTKANIADMLVQVVGTAVYLVVRAYFMSLELSAHALVYLLFKALAVIVGAVNSLKNMQFQPPISTQDREADINEGSPLLSSQGEADVFYDCLSGINEDASLLSSQEEEDVFYDCLSGTEEEQECFGDYLEQVEVD